MSIVFIILMVIGALLAAASFLIPEEKEEKSAPLSFAKSEKTSADSNFKSDANPVNTNDAITAAKNKAKEKIDGVYKFDLHLNDGADSSDRTVEELERDLLSGLDLDDAPVETEVTKPAESAATANSGSKGNPGKGGNGKNSSGRYNKNRSGKKNNYPVNDRYDDLLYEPQEVKSDAPKAQTASSNKSNSSSKGGKKGKKK